MTAGTCQVVLVTGAGSGIGLSIATEALAQSYRHKLHAFGVDSLVIQPCPYPTDLLDSQRAPRDEACLATYGDPAQIAAKRIAATRRWHASGKAPPPSEVAQALRRLLDMPFGERPFRTVAGSMDFGVRRLNKLRAETEDGVARAFDTQ
jgi:NAD(P)-dependent dehydrogenase (short-subunit alcohol dehydrogenase family)